MYLLRIVFSSFLAVILISGSLLGQSYGGLPYVRHFNPLDYNAGIQNWDIAQDRRGLVYFANNFGLLEFDGQTWEIFGVPNGTKVRSVAIDGNGRIYVGCQGDFGYFFPDEIGGLHYVSLADQLHESIRNFDETWHVYIDKESVYFCTFSRIYTYHKADNKFSVIETSGPLDPSFLVNRELYVKPRNGGISIARDTSLVPLIRGDFFSNMIVAAILPYHQDNLLVATTQHGLYVWQGALVTPWNEKLQPLWKDAIINCVIRLRDGSFAVGTQNDGLYILSTDGDVMLHMSREKGLRNRTILSLYEDDLNNLWVGQNNVISYIELGSPFTYINEQSGLPGTGYAAYLDGSTLYLGTNTGLYKRDNDLSSEFTLVPGSRGQVYHIRRYGNDLLLGHHTGAYRIENNRALKISNEPGSWTFINSKSDPSLLIEGTYNGIQLYSLDQEGHWRISKKPEGFQESSRVMAEDKSGDLWVTHGYKGVYRIRYPFTESTRNFTYYGVDKGFPTQRLINVFGIKNELLFTSEQGVYVYQPSTDSFVHDDLFTPRLGANVQLWVIQEDALGNIYIIGQHHLGVFQRSAAGEMVFQTRDFNKIRKYLNDDLENITILKNNEVLFGGKDGFIHYNPSRKREGNPQFETLIRQVNIHKDERDSVVFNGNYVQADSVIDRQTTPYVLTLPYESNSINFRFSATSYEGDSDLQFQYYLENFERFWSEWGSKNIKEYTNLKEGKYTFHVRARNANGVISSVADYTFYISAPWYRSVVAYIIYAISIIVSLFFGFSLLDSKYQREQERMVEQQEKELIKRDTKIEIIEQQSQEEITRLTNEKLESELQHKNNELATSTMHLLNKNEFISGIRASLNQLIKKESHEDVKKSLFNITKEIDQNISADNDWEHFQFHFDRVHGDFSNRFKAKFPNLSPQDIKLSAYLRMNLSTKEIAQLLNISVRGAEISRYRLRKKLQLDRNQNLQDFILNF